MATWRVVDSLFQRSNAQELVDLDILGLSDPKRTVGGVVFHGRVSPTLEMEHVVRLGQGRFSVTLGEVVSRRGCDAIAVGVWRGT
ncbi:MAG: hypothetical protein V3W34_14505 [Phycisphaerae bacterium]